MPKKVFIGVGHGGFDSGAVGRNGVLEKNINLGIALVARDELVRHGINVLMSRQRDEKDTLEDEIKECNAYAPDLAIDFHNNAGGGDGFECYYQHANSTSKFLAINIERAVTATGQNSRGIKTRLQSDGRDWYGFTRQIKCPAVLCEFAFLDTKDVETVNTSEKQRVMGIAAAKGILKTIGIDWSAPAQNYWYVWVGKFASEQEANRRKIQINGLDGKPYCEVRKV